MHAYWILHRFCDWGHDNAVLSVRPELVCPLLYLVQAFIDLGSLGRWCLSVHIQSAYRITCYARTLLLFGEMCLCDLLVVLVYNLCGHALHTEDLNLEALTTGIGILDMSEVLFVHLIHVHGKT